MLLTSTMSCLLLNLMWAPRLTALSLVGVMIERSYTHAA